jgi:thymidylate synthase (FAD)
LFITSDIEYNRIELRTIFDKLSYYLNTIGLESFLELIVPKSNIKDLLNSTNKEQAMKILLDKKKRNAGDSLKHIITDNFKTDLVITINLRALRNFFDLRLSGAAWFQIRHLAEIMKKSLPSASKKLVFKEDK